MSTPVPLKASRNSRNYHPPPPQKKKTTTAFRTPIKLPSLLNADRLGGEDAEAVNQRAHLQNKVKDILDARKGVKEALDLSDDLLWERYEAEAVYASTVLHFDVEARIDDMIDDVEHAKETLQSFNEHIRHKYSGKLEWWIIILIGVEIGFEFFHVVRGVVEKRIEEFSTR